MQNSGILIIINPMQIKLDNLRKTYFSGGKDGGRKIEAVSGVSLVIPENSIFGIIGKSGAGKSSLVRLMSLLEQPDSGAVYYGKKRVDNLTKHELVLMRRTIGMIFQNFNLFSSRNAWMNVAYPLEICGKPEKERRRRAEELLDLVGLGDRIDAPISTLSGGQKQRVAIARALATNPGILFCDEATSALDPNTTRSILSLIREIQRKMNLTVVMITHQMEVVRDACESVAVIDGGKVVECGSVRDIFANPGTETTKEFIRSVQNSHGDVVQWSSRAGAYELRFVGSSTESPVLSEATRKFGVSFNILAAGINRLIDGEVGYMEADISGSDGEIEAVIAWLNDNGVLVQKKGAGSFGGK